MSKENKDSRITGAGSRSSERREAELRVIRNMEYQDKLYIPKDLAPPGMEYGWGNHSVLNVPTPERMMELRRRGWDPVPAERHPEMAFSEFFAPAAHMKGYILRGGSILIERPIEYGKIEREQLESRNYQIMTSMPGTENFLGEPNIPTSFTNTTKSTSRNASFGG